MQIPPHSLWKFSVLQGKWSINEKIERCAQPLFKRQTQCGQMARVRKKSTISKRLTLLRTKNTQTTCLNKASRVKIENHGRRICFN